MKNLFKPGQEAEDSGQYERIGSRGGHTGEEVTMVEGKVFPPTPGAGQGYVLVDKTKH